MEERQVLLVRNLKMCTEYILNSTLILFSKIIYYSSYKRASPVDSQCFLMHCDWHYNDWRNNEWRKKFPLLPLSPPSICWKKMPQTPLKVIGLDHHYTFYSMSWGCLGHFCWKIHLFEKIRFIQCSRTKKQSGSLLQLRLVLCLLSVADTFQFGLCSQI